MGYYAITPNPNLPTLKVELFTAPSDGWTLNDPLLSRLTAGNVLEGTTDGFSDVVCEVMSASWRRGSTSSVDFLEPEPGYATIRLYDPDRNYDPSNSASPILSKLRVGSPVRISAVWQGVEYRQFTGEVWSLDWQDDVATFTVTDFLTKLARATFPAGTTFSAGSQVIKRIADVLTAVALPVQVNQSLAGSSVTVDSAAGSTNALEAIAKAVASDWGLIELTPDGELNYGPKWYENLRGLWFDLPQTLCDALASATLPGIGFDRVRNDIEATSTAAGVSNRQIDAASLSLYGRTSWSYQTLLQTVGDATAWVTKALTWYKQIPIRTPLQIVLDPKASKATAFALWPSLLQSGLGKTINVTVEGFDADALAVGITHNFDASNQSWQVFVTCAAHPLTYAVNKLTLNGGTLGYLDFGNVLT